MGTFYFKKYGVGDPQLSAGEVFYPVVCISGRSWKQEKWYELPPPVPPLFSTKIIEYHKSKDDAKDHAEKLQKEDGYETRQ